MKQYIAIVIIAGTALLGYGGYRFYILSIDNSLMSQKILALESSLQDTKTILSSAEKDKSDLSAALETTQQKLNSAQYSIEGVTLAMNSLQKLVRTDPQLLQKYSKVFFLNENYTPKSLADIRPEYLFDKNKPQQIESKVWPFLENMIKTASSNGITLNVLSAYRSFSTQAAVKTGYKVTYGAGTANQFSADQGYSEHQLGTAVDFTTPSMGASLTTNFASDNAFGWLTNNAHRYGFILSYPKGNSYYQYEPWHWRFVGITLATKLHDSNQYFYDLDQRTIDGYLLYIFD